ncbi:MAG: hypothetical protein LCH32_01170 [Bacteroidetes bacterium]|nr:hypothetical protein [Bacteroidota bacterium]
MSDDFAGKGKRRPQLDVPIDLIFPDTENPRLAKQRDSISDFDIIKTLYDEYDLEELAMSMSENGYFDEEPIILVPKTIPAGIDVNADTDTVQKQLAELVKAKKIEFIVVEGNRRTATAKILTDSELRTKLKIREGSFPSPKNNAVREDLSILPSIVYFDRKQVAPYLGVRHITGLLKWDAFAKAAYIAQNIDESVKSGEDIKTSIKNIQQQIADRSDVIKKQYLCFKVMKEAEDDLSFETKKIKDKFSLLTVALNSPSIRAYIGAPTYKDANFQDRIVPINKTEQLKNLLTWIYGDGKKEPVLSDSRRITSELAPVLASKEATDFLIKNHNLEEAYERSEGERDYIVRKINTASSSIKYALGFAWKYKKDAEIKEAIAECFSAIEELQKMINSND